MDENKILRYDFDTLNGDGSDNLTQTLMDLLNAFPILKDRQYIEFQVLDTTKGIAMFPSPSVAILTERESITGLVRQDCVYGFTIVYRTRGTDKEYVKEWLDSLGKWLEQQTIRVDDTEYQLTEYPLLSDGMKFKKISRTTQAYLYGTTEDKAEDWAISIQANYSNEYQK